jgi:hypothetical protein
MASSSSAILALPSEKKIEINPNQVRQWKHLAGDDVFVTAVSIRQRDASRILHKPHLKAVVAAIFVVRLVEAPGEVIDDWHHLRTRAPRPPTFAALLDTSSPVDEVELPVFYTKMYENIYKS